MKETCNELSLINQ